MPTLNFNINTIIIQIYQRNKSQIGSNIDTLIRKKVTHKHRKNKQIEDNIKTNREDINVQCYTKKTILNLWKIKHLEDNIY